jgi:nucleoside-diphosphate-sugar epimerase
MRIFLTGATGYVGSAVLEALVRGGHDVTALVRKAGAGSRLAARGVRTVVGDLSDPASYREAAAGHDAYILTALEASPRGIDADRESIKVLLDVARDGAARAPAGTIPPAVIYTSGIWILGSKTEPAAEESPLQPADIVAWRPAHEQLVLDAGSAGLRTAVVRPGIVYGGSRGLVGDLFRDAWNGLVRVMGRGENHWPLIYDRDLADLYARIVARQDARGVFHANDEGDERVNDLVEAIGSHMQVRPDVRYVPLGEARAKYGALASALALDQIVRSPRARALGWAPTLRSVSGNVPRLLAEWRAGQAHADT